MTDKRIRKLKRKLQEARFRLFENVPEFAEPLYSMLFVAVDDLSRMSTNGACIYVDPGWLQQLPPVSLEMMLGHQLMHRELGHIDRPRYYAGERYHLACDIIANSRLRAMGYAYDTLPRVGTLFHETFYPAEEGAGLTPEEAFRQIPFDPAALKDKKDVRYVIDSDAYWDRKTDRGERGVILLSPDDEDPDDLQIARERLLTADEEKKRGRLRKHPEEVRATPGSVEDGTPDQRHIDQDVPAQEPELSSLLESLRRRKKEDEYNAAAESASRIWQKPNDPGMDWRSLLNTFLQEELCDYSFLPPDRRYQDCDFFLPDFSEASPVPLDVFFAVDTSGSIDEEQLSEAYAEICGAIEQFGNQLTGVLAFFDTRVYPPIRFSMVEDIKGLIPQGGGGTDFSCLFRYLSSGVRPPACIVIFTDGQGMIPDEAESENTPVLWLLSRENVSIPWGRQALLKRRNGG